jgi:hypothetical protein
MLDTASLERAFWKALGEACLTGIEADFEGGIEYTQTCIFDPSASFRDFLDYRFATPLEQVERAETIGG